MVNKNVLKEEYDAYVVCSTLNQIVNYIPYKMIKKVKCNENIKVCNITTEEALGDNNGRFDNKAWDKRLETEMGLPFDEILYINKNKIEIIGLEKLDECKRILFNITGGQRSTIVLLHEYINKRIHKDDNQDTVIYLEGNSNELVVGRYCNKEKAIKYEKKEIYYDSELDIMTAMKLAGFEVDSETNYLKDIDDDSKKILDNIHKFYNLICYSDLWEDKYSLLDYLIASNKKEQKNYDIKVGVVAWKKMKSLYDEGTENAELIKNVLKFCEEKHEKSTNKFGYILEYMALKVIRDIICNDSRYKKFFVDLRHSIKIKNNNHENNKFAEIDIALLTRSGQMIIFECKSGGMSGDTARARHYVSYATSGVYGTPIVITPLIERKDSYEKGHRKKLYKDTILAINSAKRANMEVWNINDLKNEIKDYFESFIEKEGES